MLQISTVVSRVVAIPAALAPLALVLLLVPVMGQVPGGVGSTRGDYGVEAGSHTIKGTIHLADGSPIGTRRFRISVASADSTTRSTRTDVDGKFAFNSVTAGNFTVSVEATDEYEAATESVPIDRAAGSPIYEVAIFLRRKFSVDPAFAGIPKPALEAYSKGLQAVEKRDDKQAEEQFSKAIATAPNFGQALAQLGALYLKKGDTAKAVETLRKAVAAKGDDFDARYNYGAALYYKGDFTAAEKELREAVKLRETSPMPHMYLGLSLIKLKQLDEAKAELEKAVNLPNGDRLAMAHKMLGGLYWSSDPKRAADELEKYVTLEPKAPDAEKIRASIKDLRAKAGG